MPRRSSGRSRSSGFSMPRPAARSPPKPKPAAAAPRAPAPTPAPTPRPAPLQTGSATGGLSSAVAEGMAFGGGNAIANRAVDAVMGPRAVRHETVASVRAAEPTPHVNSIISNGLDACSNQYKSFQGCLNSSLSNISKCQMYMNMLAECRKGSPGGLIV